MVSDSGYSQRSSASPRPERPAEFNATRNCSQRLSAPKRPSSSTQVVSHSGFNKTAHEQKAARFQAAS
jgi:hypothetical protein